MASLLQNGFFFFCSAFLQAMIFKISRFCGMSLSLIFPDVPWQIKEMLMSSVVIFSLSLLHVTSVHVPFLFQETAMSPCRFYGSRPIVEEC